MQCLSDVVAKVGDGVDDGGLFGGSGVVLLHQVVLQSDEVQSVVGDTTTVHLHLKDDGVVHLDHQTPDRIRTQSCEPLRPLNSGSDVSQEISKKY